jgi:hypothetical protein
MNADMHDERQPADPHFQAWWRQRRAEILRDAELAGTMNPKRKRSTRDTLKELLVGDRDTN